jgi:polygalacturonase
MRWWLWFSILLACCTGARPGPAPRVQDQARRGIVRSPGAPNAGGVNVRDYGAKCDGDSNDTDAIMNAIEAASALPGGGEVHFPLPSSING